MSQNREEYIISLIDRGVSSGLRDVSSSVNDLRDKMDGLQTKVGSGSRGLSGSLSGLVGMVGRLGAVAGVGYLAKQVWDLGTGMEQTRVAFGTFMGDTQKANKLIGELNQFANVTPFDNAEVIKSGQMLLSAGMVADDIKGSLGTLGDIASGVKMPLDELAQIYSKSMNKGKLQAEELNQISERGIPLMQELARMTGKSKGELYKLAESGAITSDVLTTAFQNMTSEGGIYNNLMQKQSETTAGKFSTLIGQLQTIGIKVGEAILPVLNAFVSFGVAITSNKELLKDIGIVLGIVAGALVVYKTAMLISTIATGGFSTAFATLNAIMYANPIGVIIGAIALLVTGVVLAIRHFETWGEILLFLSGGLGMIVVLIKKIYDGWDGIKNAFKSEGIISGLKKIGSILLDVILSPLQKIFETFGMDSFAKSIKSLRQKVGIDIEKKTTTTEQKKLTNPLAGTMEKTNKRTKTGEFVIPEAKTKTKKTKVSNLKSGLSEIKTSAPKTFNININSLIKEQNFEMVKDVSEMKTLIKNEVSRLLLGVVNDVQTT